MRTCGRSGGSWTRASAREVPRDRPRSAARLVGGPSAARALVHGLAGARSDEPGPGGVPAPGALALAATRVVPVAGGARQADRVARSGPADRRVAHRGSPHRAELASSVDGFERSARSRSRGAAELRAGQGTIRRVA